MDVADTAARAYLYASSKARTTEVRQITEVFRVRRYVVTYTVIGQ